MRSACWLTQLSLFFLVLGIQCRFSWLQASQALCHLTCFPGPGSSLPMAILGLELNTLWLMKSLRHRPPKEKTTFCQTISREKKTAQGLLVEGMHAHVLLFHSLLPLVMFLTSLEWYHRFSTVLIPSGNSSWIASMVKEHEQYTKHAVWLC